MSMAFRNIPLDRQSWRYLILKARDPMIKKWYYFIDKCLPFRSSISCALFQEFSDSVAHIVKVKTGKRNVNYLDDFFFAALMKLWCDWQLRQFLEVCKEINFPVSLEKTFWGTQMLVFLGLLIYTVNQVVCISEDKITRAKQMADLFLNKQKKKVTVNQIQKLTGFPNFLCRCVIPGRAFVRRMYSYVSSKLKPRHHIRITNEMRQDMWVWMKFLEHPSVFCKPFLDYTK